MTIGYIYGKLDFPIFLLLGEWLVAQYFPKRKYFPLRVLFVSVLLIGFNFLQYFIKDLPYEEARTFLILLHPTFVFLISFLGMMFSFKATVPSLLMAASVGYCLQNPSYCMASLIRLAIGFDAEDCWYFMFLLVSSIFSIYYFTLYFLYLRDPERRKGIDRIKEKRQIIITFIAASTLSVISCLGMECAARSGLTKSWVVVYLFNIAVGLISVTSELELLTTRRSVKEATRIKTMYEKDKENFKQAKDNIEMVNVKMHDLRHKIDNLSDRLDPNEIEKLKDDMEGYVQLATTSCPALDLVLQEKSIAFANEKIRFTCFMDASPINYIPKESLYSLFENAISNAVEAVRGLEESKRIISMTGRNYGDFYNIRIENYCQGEEEIEVGKTTKNDKINHGFGLKSIIMIMERYDGRYSIEKQGDIFSLSLVFSIPKKPDENS